MPRCEWCGDSLAHAAVCVHSEKQQRTTFYCSYSIVMASAISFKQSQYICQWTAPRPKMQRIGFDVIIHSKNKGLINFEMDILFL